jgi:hypothetical protein
MVIRVTSRDLQRPRQDRLLCPARPPRAYDVSTLPLLANHNARALGYGCTLTIGGYSLGDRQSR